MSALAYALEPLAPATQEAAEQAAPEVPALAPAHPPEERSASTDGGGAAGTAGVSEDLPEHEAATKIEKRIAPHAVFELADGGEDLVKEMNHRLEYSDLTEDDKKWADEACVRRYLRAEEGALERAHKRLLATAEWRKKMLPLTRTCPACDKDFRAHDLRCIGEDRYGRPVMYNCFAACTNRNPYHLLDHFIMNSEECIRRMSDKQETWVWICDFEGFGLMDTLDPRFSIWLVQMLQNHYPERLGACLIIDAPRVFTMIWRAAKSIMAADTLNKCVWIRGKEGRAAMAKALSDGELGTWLEWQMEFNRDRKQLKESWKDPHKKPEGFVPK